VAPFNAVITRASCHPKGDASDTCLDDTLFF
jgi:hypothetical protein